MKRTLAIVALFALIPLSVAPQSAAVQIPSECQGMDLIGEWRYHPDSGMISHKPSGDEKRCIAYLRDSTDLNIQPSDCSRGLGREICFTANLQVASSSTGNDVAANGFVEFRVTCGTDARTPSQDIFIQAIVNGQAYPAVEESFEPAGLYVIIELLCN